MSNLAILDIDGSITNKKKNFPKFENEESVLRTLNNLKNRRIFNYDFAFKSMVGSDTKED